MPSSSISMAGVVSVRSGRRRLVRDAPERHLIQIRRLARRGMASEAPARAGGVLRFGTSQYFDWPARSPLARSQETTVARSQPRNGQLLRSSHAVTRQAVVCQPRPPILRPRRSRLRRLPNARPWASRLQPSPWQHDRATRSLSSQDLRPGLQSITLRCVGAHPSVRHR